MDYIHAVKAVRRSIVADDSNGLKVEGREDKILVEDETGRHWVIMLVEVLPDPDHTAEECPDRLDKPEYTIPATVFHGPHCPVRTRS